MYGGRGLSSKELSRMYQSGGAPVPIIMNPELARRICNAIYNVANLNIVDDDLIIVDTLHHMNQWDGDEVTVEEIVAMILDADPMFEDEGLEQFVRDRVEIVLYNPEAYDPAM